MSSVHPLLQLLLSRPELFVEHAAAYAGLAGEEGQALLARWQRQWRWRLIGYLALSMALLLAGQALMLWALFRPADGVALLLLLLPLLPLGIALLALQAAAALQPRTPDEQGFAVLRRQLADDMTMLRASHAAHAEART